MRAARPKLSRGLSPPAEKGRTPMATMKQRQAARHNIKKAAAAAKRKQTLRHLPKRVRQALGREAAKARRRNETRRG